MEHRISRELKRYNYLFSETGAAYHEMYMKLGLSDSAMMVLYAVLENGDCRLLKEICQSTGLSKQTVNSSIRTLERQGLIRLTPGRGREEHIHFTEKGRRLAEERILPVMEAENRTLAELGEDAALVLALQQKHLEIFRRRARALIANQSDETT